MKKAITEIQQIINPSKFQKIQDDTAKATGLSIITVDCMGVPITSHSCCNEFCKIVRASPKYAAYCEKCDSRGGLEAARNHEPYIYLCHAGIVDLAIPILSGNLYLGAFMAGQVLLERDENYDTLERILHGAGRTIDLDSDPKLRESYNKLPVMSLEKIKALSNMLLHIGNYCVENAMLRASAAQLSMRQTVSKPIPEDRHKDTEDSGLAARGTSHMEVSSILRPALDYIKQNPSEKLTLSYLASLCNISPSYFSKLFAKENLGSLSNYVNNVKLDSAVKLLRTTDLPVHAIADRLGYDDCGYFIKIFKKLTGKTPMAFRKSAD